MRKRDGKLDEEIGARLRQFRVRLRLSQTQLGKKLGVTFQQIQKYEKGENAIASTRIPALCEALDITPNDLFRTLGIMVGIFIAWAGGQDANGNGIPDIHDWICAARDIGKEWACMISSLRKGR